MSNGKTMRNLALAILGAFIAIIAVSFAPSLGSILPNGSGSDTQSEQAQGSGEQTDQTTNEEEDMGTPFSEDHKLRHAEIVVKDYGTIKVELDATVAPESVENFCRLAAEGFYNGNSFHRIISGFMIQGGADHTGSQPKITGEFSANGHVNNIKHDRGVISMARATDPNSASTQFFIVHKDSPHLDGNYAGFGRVTEGMEVVDAIAENTPVQDNNGTVAEADQPIIETVNTLD